MDRMRTTNEQFIGLNQVALLVAQQGCNCAVEIPNVGDIVIAHVCGPSEIVYATGGYDVWRNGHLTQPDLTADKAAHVLVDEYRMIKARRKN